MTDVDSAVQFILGVLIIVIGIAVAIALHEIGHLVPAKIFKVKVTRYMIGFGPTLWSFRRGETEYGIKAFPLGGYVAMSGMFPPKPQAGRVERATRGFFARLVQDARDASAETIGNDDSRAFYRLAVWKKIIIMVGGPFMNLVQAVVLFAVVLCVFGTVQLSTTVGSVNQCVVPVGSERDTCEPGDPAAPGAEAGLQPGDTLLSINGTPVESWAQSTQIIRDSAGVPLTLNVERDGEIETLTVTPLLTQRYELTPEGTVATNPDGSARTIDVGFVGIGAATELVPQPVTSVLPAVGENISGVVGIVLNLPQRLVDVANAAFGPGERDPNGPISVVGVGRAAGEIASIDELPLANKAAGLVGLLASLNVALFVINLVPLLPLDGGHIVGALYEGLRRTVAKMFGRKDPGPVDTARMMPLTVIVVAVFACMSALLIYADIVKPVNLFG